MNQSLFRKRALDHLSSPEQLDQLVQITPPRAWIALTTLILLLVAGLVWGIFGSIPESITGTGVLLMGGKNFSITSNGTGMIEQMKRLHPGDHLHKGDVIGKVSAPEEKLQLEIDEANVSRLQLSNSPELASGLEKMHFSREKLKLRSELVAPFDGVVIEVKAKVGQNVTPGTPVMVLSEMTGDISAQLYVPAKERINLLQPGMKAEVTPLGFNKERYGYLFGKVVSIAEFPSSAEAMNVVLEDSTLVQSLQKEGPSYAVMVELEKDPSSASGLKWSSDKSKKILLDGGECCSAQFVVSKKSPLTLVFPIFDRISP